jgi:hypothetical protein
MRSFPAIIIRDEAAMLDEQVSHGKSSEHRGDGMSNRRDASLAHLQPEDAVTELTFMQHNRAALVEIACTGYLYEGRGAILVQAARATSAGTPTAFISDAEFQEADVNWPAVPIRRMIATYDPCCECVVVFVRTDQRISAYTVRFTDVQITSAA